MREHKNFGKGFVYVDRSGCAHLDGNPLYDAAREAQKPLFATRLKDNTLVADAEANQKGAVEVTTAVVRTGCEKGASLRKKKAFDEYFIKEGRRGGESVQDYIGRCQNEYDLLTSLSS